MDVSGACYFLPHEGERVRRGFVMERLYEIGTSDDGTYVFARRFRLPYSKEIADKVAGDLYPLGQHPGVLGYLVDIRGTTSATTPHDKYEYAYRKTTDIGVRRSQKMALLKDAGDHSADFMEIVMKNAGYMFRIFEDEGLAIDWLRATKSSKT